MGASLVFLLCFLVYGSRGKDFCFSLIYTGSTINFMLDIYAAQYQ